MKRLVGVKYISHNFSMRDPAGAARRGRIVRPCSLPWTVYNMALEAFYLMCFHHRSWPLLRNPAAIPLMVK